MVLLANGNGGSGGSCSVPVADFCSHPAAVGLDAFPPDHLQRTLDLAARTYCAPSVWGDHWFDGICYITAHLLSSQIAEMNRISAQGAQLAEGKQQQPMTPYAGQTEDAMRSTHPGSEYLRLRDIVVGFTARTMGM